MNVVLQDVEGGCRLVFRMWAQFVEALVQQFEPIMERKEARKQGRT